MEIELYRLHHKYGTIWNNRHYRNMNNKKMGIRITFRDFGENLGVTYLAVPDFLKQLGKSKNLEKSLKCELNKTQNNDTYEGLSWSR